MISGDDVCCSVVFGTLVGLFSVIWSDSLMTSAISCPLWSSVYERQRVECAFTSPMRTECGMFVMYCMQCCMSVSAVFHMCGIMLVLTAVFNMLLRNASLRGPLCFRCLLFNLSGPCELLFLLCFIASWT